MLGEILLGKICWEKTLLIKFAVFCVSMDFVIHFENSKAFWVQTEKYYRNKSIVIFLLGYLNMDYQVKKTLYFKTVFFKKENQSNFIVI